VVAAWLIAQRGVNTLILVHRRQLLEQWIERLSSFLDLPAKAIGRLGGGRNHLTGALDVALMQSLVRKEVVDDRVADYGHLIVDECHHISARSFELAVRRAKGKFITGLSATVTRKDGHHPIIFMQCGPIRHRVDAKTQAAARPFTHHVLVRPTGFRASAAPNPDPRAEFHQLYEALRNDDKRNQMICADIVNAIKEGRTPLVLTERIEHLQCLAQRLSPEIPHLILLRGGQSKKEFAAALARLAEIPETTGRALLATGGYIGEGFDDWTPCSWSCLFRGGEPLPRTSGGSIDSMNANAKCASMTMLTWMFPCWPECLINGAVDMIRSVITVYNLVELTSPVQAIRRTATSRDTRLKLTSATRRLLHQFPRKTRHHIPCQCSSLDQCR